MTTRTRVAVGVAVLVLLGALLWSRSGGEGSSAGRPPRTTGAASVVPPPVEGTPQTPPGPTPPPEPAPPPAAEEAAPATPPPPAVPGFLRLDLRPLPPRDPAPPPSPGTSAGAGAGARVGLSGGAGEGGFTMRAGSKWAPVPEKGSATFRGKVLDAAGRPLAGAEVVRVDPKGGGADGDVLSFEFVAAIATTGADGTFEAVRQPVRPFRLGANYRRVQNRPRGFELHATVPVDPSADQVLEGIVLSVPVDGAAFGVVEGIVVDEGGRPLPGCQVMAGFQDAWTKADGRFRFEAVPAGEVAVSARKFAWGRWSRTEPLEAGGAASLRIVLEPESRGPNRLEGRVVDDAGVPVAGVKVWMGGRRDLARDTVTGDDGGFAFEGLPELGDATVSVSVMPDPENGDVLPTTVQGVRIPTAGLELRVERTVRLRLRFSDRITGEPLPRFAYEVMREKVVDGERRMVPFRSGSPYREDGAVEMRVPRVELHFFVEAPDRDPVHAAVTIPTEGDGPFEVAFGL